MNRGSRLRAAACLALAGVALTLFGASCKKSNASTDTGTSTSAEKSTIQNIGSDTMVNLAQAWAEEYAKKQPGVSVEVSGGGSGVGIAALINGTADIANASRKLEPEEIQKASQSNGQAPAEYLVGFDALAIYVHKDNPINEISVEELGEIYREGGSITKWSQLGVTAIPGATGDEIIRISRQNNSGTYHYFRETVVGKKADFRRGSLDMNGSKEVVSQVQNTPTAIGYSGMGYATPFVKRISVSKKKGQPGVAPSIASVRDHTYPIARPMFMYTPGKPAERVKKYIDWVVSPDGQKLVETTGYVPLTFGG